MVKVLEGSVLTISTFLVLFFFLSLSLVKCVGRRVIGRSPFVWVSTKDLLCLLYVPFLILVLGD